MVLMLSPLALQTRAGSNIRNFRRTDPEPFRLAAGVELITKGHPQRTLRSMTQIYNCFGLAFASRRTWVDDNIRRILEEDNYEVVTPDSLQIGDVVLYTSGPEKEPVHVAVIAETSVDIENTFVISQWGRYGEFVHKIGDVIPDLGEPTEYWTDRKVTQ